MGKAEHRDFIKRLSVASRAGFTLVEMLAAMTILVVLILFLGRVVTDSTTIWSTGMRRSEVNNAGRAVIDFMLYDLGAAIADSVLRFQVNSDTDDAFGFGSDEIRFVALDEPPGRPNRRSAREVVYYITNMRDAENEPIDYRYRLMRQRVVNLTGSPGMSAYSGDNPSDSGLNWVTKPRFVGAEDVAENVRTLEIWAYSYDYDQPGFNTFDYDTMRPYPGQPLTWGPPLWVDVYLEFMSDADAARAAQLAETHGETGDVTIDFVRRNSQRFAARAFLHNSAGYHRPNEHYPFYEPFHDEFNWPPFDVN